jgi:hypothetical protein
LGEDTETRREGDKEKKPGRSAAVFSPCLLVCVGGRIQTLELFLGRTTKGTDEGEYMTAARYLIVNADDFGQSPGVNRGIIQGFDQGIVTSASLMVRWPAAAPAAGPPPSLPARTPG